MARKTTSIVTALGIALMLACLGGCDINIAKISQVLNSEVFSPNHSPC